MNERHEDLGRIIDDIDSLAHALTIPLPPEMHIVALRDALPAKVSALKAAFVGIAGYDPWSTLPR
ncbi:hypothetical protein [Orrella marina]|nr:hypothetical protein [Orrella marina]